MLSVICLKQKSFWGLMKSLTNKASLLTRQTSLQYVKGVGPKIAELFAKRDLWTVDDLLRYYPRVYEDRKAAAQIAGLKPNELVSLRANIVQVQTLNLGRTNRKIYDIAIRDSSGQIHCKFFRAPYRGYFERFKPFQEIRVVGKPLLYRGKLEFHHPDLKDVLENEDEEDSIIPIYTEIENLTSAKIRKIIQTILNELPDSSWSESLPQSIVQKYDLLSNQEAIRLVHTPPAGQGEQLMKYESPAQLRLIFEEFFWFELLMAIRHFNFKSGQAMRVLVPNNFIDQVKNSLPFELTNAQKRVLGEVFVDIAKTQPMSRLVQGDVGSGKTMVAFLAALANVQGGYQVALMAPTEILAEQHFKNAVNVLGPHGVRVGYLSGSSSLGHRKELLPKLESGQVDLIIGTHALIEDEVKFGKLSLVIIDEQHRFGVRQRGRLKSKGIDPHFLIMTATPIPRTLALTVYGDLEVSVIDELPKGRSPILTKVTSEAKRPQVMGFIKDHVTQGRQAYIVYPLVDESEKIDLKNALEEYQKIQSLFPTIKVGLLHGRMKSEEKEQVMTAFRQNQVQILVSTTVIEVGVDVPNATIMMIEHAERFGLSQLHQLRGRVGRGSHKSFCILMPGYALSEEGKYRLSVMESTTDGFKVAEADLELRGPGEFLGSKQSGDIGFKLASLTRDVTLLTKAREAAFDLIRSDPRLQKPENHRASEYLKNKQNVAELAQIG